jgi:flagellar biosynthesis protein FlhB
MEEAEQDRTEQATPHKRSEARKRGQVAKSLDFNTMVIMAGFSVVLGSGAALGMSQLETTFRALLIAAGQSDSQSGLSAVFPEFAHCLLTVMLPVCIAAVLLSVVANLAQTGPVLSSDPLEPQLSRLNPIAGFKRVYTKRLWIDALKALVKLGCFSAVTSGFFTAIWPTLPNLMSGDALFTVGWFAAAAKTLVFRILLVLAIIGLLDLLWARWQFSRQLMMSRRETKEEIKRREGDPFIRQRIRELQRENLKQARSLRRVRGADVLITNPNHIAVALAYDRATMHAPRIIAMGTDLWAEQMKAKARQHGVTILERRPLAQRLYQLGAIDQPIPPETYLDVAHVYAELPRTRATLLAGASGPRASGQRGGVPA